METISVGRVKALDIKENTVIVLKNIDNSDEIIGYISDHLESIGLKNRGISITLNGESELYDLSKADILKVCKHVGITAEDLKW